MELIPHKKVHENDKKSFSDMHSYRLNKNDLFLCRSFPVIPSAILPELVSEINN
jgi:hypothetical protein